ncbi:MAG: hypothetical protein WKF77_06205 [Planctomycetaceae bacterium]
MSGRNFDDARKRRQLEQAREEREAGERRQREAEANRRKPHASSSWQDPAFCNRVLKRAETHMQAVAQIRDGNFRTSSPTARERWDAAVKSAVAHCGGNKMKAVAMANKQNPGLRLKMLAEVNSKR